MKRNFTYLECVAYAKNSLSTNMKVGMHNASVSIVSDGGFRANVLQAHGVQGIRNEPAAIIERARCDPRDFDAILYGGAHFIHMGSALGYEMPKEIRKWIADYLLGKLVRPVSKEGRPKKTGLHLAIVGIIQRLQEKTCINLTRNDEIPAPSICDAVADALSQLDMSPNSYRGVKDLWIYRDRTEASKLNI